MITQRQLDIMQHALGLDQYGRGTQHRNHYCAGGDDVADCAELVTLGYMRSFRREWLPYFSCFVTEAGIRAVLRESPEPPKLTRSQQRYRRYLNVADLMSFKEFCRRESLQARGEL